jgi:peptide/nickel transport system permease protein
VSAAIVAATAPTTAAAREGLAGIFWARFVCHRPAVISAGVIALLALSSIFAGPIAMRDPLRIEMSHKFARPLAKGHLLGADELGRDVLSRLLHAGRISLTVGLAAMAVTVTVGAVLGMLAGYVRGAVDTVLLRLTDAMLSFPPIFMLLALAAFVRPSLASP